MQYCHVDWQLEIIWCISYLTLMASFSRDAGKKVIGTAPSFLVLETLTSTGSWTADGWKEIETEIYHLTYLRNSTTFKYRYAGKHR